MGTPTSRALLKARYRLLQTIGEGGMGTVYKAEDIHLGNRLVAIKEMLQPVVSDQEQKQMVKAFQQEAEILARLQHPNLPGVHDHFSEKNRWYLVMAFIEGVTLEEYQMSQPQQRLQVEEVMNIGQQLCLVLDYLHNRHPPIIFRDLKPANIMRTAQGHLYLIDFGIARHFKPGQSRDTAAFGSLGYAAPEQYGRSQTSPRSDIYSLGATLHQLLSGHNPSLTPLTFAPLPASVSSVELRNLIQEMVEFDAQKRPASAFQIANRLRRIASLAGAGQGQSTLSTRVQPEQKAQKLVIDKPLPGGSNINASAHVDHLFRPRASIGTVLSVFEQHVDQITAVSWSPDGKRIASSSRDGAIHVWDVATGKLHLSLRWPNVRVTCLAWSGNNQTIASGGSDRLVYVWQATTGDLLAIYRGHNGLWDGGPSLKALSWSPDSRAIASVSEDHTVQVWQALSGEKLLVYSEHSLELPVRLVAWSPDGKYLASAGLHCHIWEAATGKTIAINQTRHPLAIDWSARSEFIVLAYAGELSKEAASIKIWEISTGRQYSIMQNSKEPAKIVAYSPDGCRIAVVQKHISLWSTAEQAIAYTYTEHANEITALSWSPDSTRIASGGVDGTIQIWVASA